MNAAEVRVAVSPLASKLSDEGPHAGTIREWYVQIEKARGQLKVLGYTIRHRHVGTCPASELSWQPTRCECLGPQMFERHLALVSAVFAKWIRTPDPAARMEQLPIVKTAIESLGPPVVVCYGCSGDGWVGVRDHQLKCPKCEGIGVRRPGPRMNVPREER